jgi:anti-sigma factor RsiW
MKLNRNNYEEYFILYLDNELSSEDRREVEAFAQENPDLKAELDILLQSKLIPDADITYTNKELLMIRNSSSISMANHEEWLLSYIDNELTEEERKDVEKFVAGNPAVQTELNLLQQVKLQPEAIVFPYKESLYHKEEKTRVVAIRWWRIAAAAVLLLGISTTAVVLVNNKRTSDGIAKEQPKDITPTISTPVKQPGNVTPVNQEAIATTDPKKIDAPINEPVHTIASKQNKNEPKEKKEQPVPVKNDEPVIVQNNTQQSSNNLARPVNNTNVNDKAKPDDAIVSIDPSNPALTDHKGNSNATDVTSHPSDTYNNTNGSDIQDKNSDFVFASEKSGNKGLRGFFRKVTRTFEKRTNIKATDDDDRLLIAGLAIKMN